MNLRQTLRWPVNLLRQWFPSPVDGVGRTILQPILQNLLQDFLSAIFVFFRFTGCKTPLYVFLHGLWPVLGSVRNQVNSFMVWTYIKKEVNPTMRPYRVWAPADAGAVAVTGEEVRLSDDACSPGEKVCSETGEHWTWRGLLGILNFTDDVPGASGL